jgi:hypothetical protein
MPYGFSYGSSLSCDRLCGIRGSGGGFGIGAIGNTGSPNNKRSGMCSQPNLEQLLDGGIKRIPFGFDGYKQSGITKRCYRNDLGGSRDYRIAYGRVHGGQEVNFGMATSLFFFFILVSSTSALTPTDWNEQVKNGLMKIATKQTANSYINQSDAAMLMNDWFGIKIRCSVPTENMWLSYCQQFYISEGGDCGSATPENKKMIMDNMVICQQGY